MLKDSRVPASGRAALNQPPELRPGRHRRFNPSISPPRNFRGGVVAHLRAAFPALGAELRGSKGRAGGRGLRGLVRWARLWPPFLGVSPEPTPGASRGSLSPLVAAGGRRQVSAPPSRLLTPSSPAPGLRPRPGPLGRPARGAGGRRPKGRARREGGRAGPGRVSTCGRTWPLGDAPRAGRDRAGLRRSGGGPAGVPGWGWGWGRGLRGPPPPTSRPARTPGSGGVGFGGTCPYGSAVRATTPESFGPFGSILSGYYMFFPELGEGFPSLRCCPTDTVDGFTGAGWQGFLVL